MFDYYNIFISPEEYKSLKNLEGLTGEQAYKKYGYKRDEKVSCEFDLGCQYKLTVSMVIPDKDEDTVQADAVIYNIQNDMYFDAEEYSDSILGLWCFGTDAGELCVNLKIKETKNAGKGM